ncbi:hypothetical protein [Kribbella sp. NPDC004536]|uniref:hypothetical protein n=1 Tax=Kribbella sp. NPDC004536 TaxID=3364106 RepID=UPI00368A1ADA
MRAELHEGVGRPLDDLHREALAAPDEIDAAARIALSGVARAVPPPALGVNGPEVDRYDPDAGKDAYDSWRETTDGARQSTGSRVGTTDGGSLKK